MIQLNLLPDVKLEYVHAQRTKRLIATAAIFVSIAAIALMALLFGYDLYQKNRIHSLNNSINSEVTTLTNEKDINKILTVQNQLSSLTQLHDQKPVLTNIFDYIYKMTPANASISSMQIDTTKNTITITGSTDTIATVNQYIDTVKLTTYTSASKTTPTSAFSNVVLSSFGVSSKGKGNTASYSITLNYDPNIFKIDEKANLTINSTTTTRLELQNPTDLFSAQNASNNSGGQ